MNTTRTITIVCGKGHGLFAVHEGEAYVTHLTWDEMLGEIAQLTHPRICESRYGMATPEEHIERSRLTQERMKFHRASDVRAMQLSSLEELVRWQVKRGGRGDRPLPLEEQPQEVRRAIERLRFSKAPDWMPE